MAGLEDVVFQIYKIDLTIVAVVHRQIKYMYVIRVRFFCKTCSFSIDRSSLQCLCSVTLYCIKKG